MMADCECVVIGAGVVGLAIAAKLAQSGRDVLILEQESSYGSMTSARNSEVIHAGIYYPAGSLKAQFCVEGRKALYAYCQQRHIGHKRSGKLIVATNDAQAQELADIRKRAVANGVTDLQYLTEAQAQALEPSLACVAALLSPSTGIIDSHGLMVSLLGDAEANGAVLALRAPVRRLSRVASSGFFQIETNGDEPTSLTSQWVINTAGHGACQLASSLSELSSTHCPAPLLSKGNYFRLQGRAPFSRLIYPVPEPGGLGVHITIDLAGQARFGPDVEAIEREDYAVDPARSDKFYEAIRRYWPGLPDAALTPDYAGIRPKLLWQGEPYNDFMITSMRDHGVPGLINLFGIESPGLTSCLAIAEHVNQLSR